MSIKSELHEAILRKGGKIPTHGGIAAALDELNRLPGGGDCDWNTMKNRPFGTEIGMVEVLGETTLQFVDFDGTDTFVFADYIPVEANKTYVVNWNGTEYSCVAILMEGPDYMFWILGNTSVLGAEDTGEPFFLHIQPETEVQAGGYGLVAMALDGSTTVTLSIHTEGEIVTQIDPKYIPGGAGGGGSFIVTAVLDASTMSVAEADRTFDEILAAFLEGRIPFVKLEMQGSVLILPIAFISNTSESASVDFSATRNDYVYTLSCFNNNQWEFIANTLS